MPNHALGGGDIYGDKLVRLVYVDEAGISDTSQEPFAVVAGVVVDVDKKLVQLRSELDRIVAKHIPEQQCDGFVLHATEIFNGGKVMDRTKWPMERRLAVADDLAKLPRKMQLPLVFGWVDKAKFVGTVDGGSTKREQNTDAHLVSYLRCAWQADRWLRDKTENEHCIMVVENHDEAKGLIRESQAAFQNAGKMALTSAERQHFPFRRIQEEPLFQAKRPSSVLQLADFCAFIFKRFLMDPSGDYARRFWAPMRGLAYYYDPVSGSLVSC
jgi:hypothetical protein